MARYPDTLIDEVTDAPIKGAFVYIYVGDRLAALTDDSGNTLPQPIITPQTGAYAFNTADGVYQRRIYVGARLKREDDINVGDPPAYRGDPGGSAGLVGTALSITNGQTLPAGINGVFTSGASQPGVGPAPFGTVTDNGQQPSFLVRRYSNAVVRMAITSPTLAQVGALETDANVATLIDHTTQEMAATGQRYCLTGDPGRAYKVGQRSDAGDPNFTLGARVRPSVDFDGKGVTLNPVNANTDVALYAWGEVVDYALVNRPANAPTDSLNVDHPERFATGDTVLYRLGSDPRDLNESVSWGIATVTGVYPGPTYNPPGISLNRQILRDLTAAQLQPYDATNNPTGYKDADFNYGPDPRGGTIPFGSRYVYKLRPRNGQRIGGARIIGTPDKPFVSGLDHRHGRHNVQLPIYAENSGVGVSHQYQDALLVASLSVDGQSSAYYDGGIAMRLAEVRGIGTSLQTSNIAKQAIGAEAHSYFHLPAHVDVDVTRIDNGRTVYVCDAQGCLTLGGVVATGSGLGGLHTDGVYFGSLVQVLGGAPFQTAVPGRNVAGVHHLEINGTVERYSGAGGKEWARDFWLDEGMALAHVGPAGVLQQLAVYAHPDLYAGGVTSLVVRGMDITNKIVPGSWVDIPVTAGRVAGGVWLGRASPLEVDITTASGPVGGKTLAGKFLRVYAKLIQNEQQPSYAVNYTDVLADLGDRHSKLAGQTLTVAAGATSPVISIPFADAAQGDFPDGVSLSASRGGLLIVGEEVVPGAYNFALMNPTSASVTLNNVSFYGRISKRRIGL